MAATNPMGIGDPTKVGLDRRLERLAWGLFLIMIGGLLLVPDRLLPEGIWLVGTGLIMLGLNAARYLNGIRLSGVTVGLGLIALISGFSDMVGVDLPVIPVVLILIGAQIVYQLVAGEET